METESAIALMWRQASQVATAHRVSMGLTVPTNVRVEPQIPATVVDLVGKMTVFVRATMVTVAPRVNYPAQK